MGQLTLLFLGPPEVYYEGQPLKFPTRKTLALIIYLAMEGGRHSREKLAAFFWPHSDAKRSRGSLRNTLGYLRTALHPAGELLLIEPDALSFETTADLQLDTQALQAAVSGLAVTEAERITALQAAVKAYRGDFLAGFTLGDAPDFDDWASAQREHWHRQIGLGCDQLSLFQANSGEVDSALVTATRWVALDPWNEAAQRRLMQLHFMSGDRPAALRVYEACRSMLATEFGVDPAPETNALAARIRAAAPPQPQIILETQTHSPQQMVIPFIGRTTEYNRLVTAFYAASRGQPQIVILTGEAGIGKTRLAGEFVRWAVAQGADVLSGRAFESGGRLPYQPLVQALRSRLDRENAPDDLLSDIWLIELSRLLPELRDRYPDLAEPTSEEAAVRTRLFEAVARLIQALAKRRPVVFFVDDIHWADVASLDLLNYALLRWQETRAPILTLLNLRQENLATSSDLQAWLTDLGRQLPLTRLTPGTLSLAEIHQLLTGFVALDGNSPEEAAIHQLGRWLLAETGGQPFYLTETLKLLTEQRILLPQASSTSWLVDLARLNQASGPQSSAQSFIPPTVREVIKTRLARLSETAMALLTAAAVLGRRATFIHLCRVAHLDDSPGLTALDSLLVGRLLAEIGDATALSGVDPVYLFTHDKIRDVVYELAGEARRRVFHRRAFEVLEEAARQVELNPGAAELADHALHSGLKVAAFRYSLAAGDEALRLFAVRDAISHYETARMLALGLQPSIPAWSEAKGANLSHLYLQLGRAYELNEAWEQALDAYEAMGQYAQTGGNSAVACQVLNRMATVYAHGLVDLKRAMALLQEALTVATASDDKVGVVETKWNLALVARLDRQSQQACFYAEQALEMARQLEQPELIARSLNTLVYSNLRLRRWESALAYAEEARVYYAAVGDQIMEADCLRQIGWTKLFCGQPQEATRLLGTAYAMSLRLANHWGEADCAFKLAQALLEVGDYGEALRLAERGVAVARTLKHPHLMVLNLMALGTAQRTVLALDTARETQMQALVMQQEATSAVFSDWALSELCAISVLEGNWEAAQDYAHQALAAPEEESQLPIALASWYETEALLRGGDGALARSEVQHLGQWIGHNRRYRLVYLRSLAVLARWEGNAGQAMAHLEEANTLAEEIGLPGEQWPILAALGELYQTSSDAVRGREALTRSTKIIHALAATLEDETLRTEFLKAEPIRRVLHNA